MTRLAPSSTRKLRQGTQELLERRGMATTPAPAPPRLRADGPPAATGLSVGGSAFRHGGHDADVAGMRSAPAMHAELKGHRHRGAEKHSAH
ncbi:hypothetical protein OH807_23060 [Kitasatospora sp. NBC_01560]|uniref:hypothetical protein n=1 Tax=Kitasatospora sp. NBC_01560 TaxID=2975965 RepID=UPI003862E6E2